MKYNTPLNIIDAKGQQRKKQKESIKIIDNLLKENNEKCKGGAIANIIGNAMQNKDVQDVLKFYKIIMSEENKNLRRAIISIPLIYFSLKLEHEEENKLEKNKDGEEKNQKGGTEKVSGKTENKTNHKNDNKTTGKTENKPNDNNENKPNDNNENKKKDDDNNEKNDDKKETKKVCENHNNNKVKDEKALKISEKYIVNGTINYKLLRDDYKNMIKNPPQPKEKKSWFNLDMFKKKKIETDKLFEKGDIKTFLNELNKIDIQDLPIELATTLFFIKDEIDGKIDIMQEKQEKGEKTGMEGLVDEEVPNIKELKMMLKMFRKVCPIASTISRFAPKIPEDEFGILTPEIFCALLKLLDKLDKKKFESTMPSYDEKKLKLIIFKMTMNDLNNGIPVTGKCGFFPAKIGDIKEKAIGPELKNALMNNPVIANNPMLAKMKFSFGPQGLIIGEIFEYVKDFAEILCDYGIDLELIIYNANKSGIETGIILELLFKEIAKEIEGTTKSFGFSVEDITGFSIEKIINDIFKKLYTEGLYNCPNRYAKHQNIKLHTKADRIETRNPNNRIRKLFNEMFNDDIFGSMAAGPTGPVGLAGDISNPMAGKFPGMGGTRKKKSRKPKTRKRYK